jgi:hypothetical protein
MLQYLSSVLAGKPDQVDWSTFAPQDWHQFVQTAHTHGVAPLLWYTLEDIGWPDDIPMQVRNALHIAFYRLVAASLFAVCGAVSCLCISADTVCLDARLALAITLPLPLARPS